MSKQGLRINKKIFVAAVVESGMTDRELCYQADSSHQTLKKLCEGKMVRFGPLRRFCAVLGLKPAAILEDGDDQVMSESNHETVQADGRGDQRERRTVTH